METTIYTNWYKVENGKILFNHQSKMMETGDKPMIINDQYGLQSRWENEKWAKHYIIK